MVLAFVFAFGMLSPTGGELYDEELDPTAEVDEDGEVLARQGTQSRATRRSAGSTAGPGVRAIASPRAPRRLGSTRNERGRHGWLRPRRVPPPDDDDASIG